MSRVLHAKKIIIADIDIKKGEKLASFVAEKNTGNTVITVAHDEGQYSDFISHSDLIVNATPCGMKENDGPLFDYKFIDESQHVFDLVYTTDTPLVKEARRRGAKAVNGVNMLLHQAARSFELWTGKDAPLQVMRKNLLRGPASSDAGPRSG